MQMTKGLSIKAALAIFSAIVAVIFIIVGVVAYSSAGSFRGIVEKSTRNAVLQQHTGDLGKMHDSIRGNIVTYILAFERGENDWLDRTEKKYAADKKLLLVALAAADANSTQATPEVRAAIAAAKPVLETYVRDADKRIVDAKSNLIGVIAEIPEFEKSFNRAGDALTNCRKPSNAKMRNFSSKANPWRAVPPRWLPLRY